MPDAPGGGQPGTPRAAQPDRAVRPLPCKAGSGPMLDHQFPRELTLEVAGCPLRFRSLGEFEFALAGRTEVPATKIAEVSQLSPEALRQEARDIKAVERRFIDLISREFEQPGSIGRALREVDLHLFSQDHHWREIMAALRDKDTPYDELKRVAVAKYLQYLASRQELIKIAYRQQKRQAHVPANGVQEQAREGEPRFRETAVFDSQVLEAPAGNGTQEGQWQRLPKGEAVVLLLEQDLPLRLSRHQFGIGRRGEAVCFLLPEGQEEPLRPGKNIIGRDSVCNVILDDSLRDISRLHLIIELLEGGQIRLTDLSSHGTWVPEGVELESVTIV
ncbi:MAG: FHA domain-containing protein [Gammaproteobacteria bacterium]|nr:MAG: FHA domain-containing protein [Gammaproteobacteria bacterium]